MKPQAAHILQIWCVYMSVSSIRTQEPHDRATGADVYSRLVSVAQKKGVSLEQLLQNILNTYEQQNPPASEQKTLQKLLHVHRQTRDLALANIIDIYRQLENEASIDNPAKLLPVIDNLKRLLLDFEKSQNVQYEFPHAQRTQQLAGHKRTKKFTTETSDTCEPAYGKTQQTACSQLGAQVETHFQILSAKINQLLADSGKHTFTIAGSPDRAEPSINPPNEMFEKLASKEDLAVLHSLAKLQVKLCEEQAKLSSSFQQYASQQTHVQSNLNTLLEQTQNNNQISERIHQIHALAKAIKPSVTREMANLLDLALQKIENNLKTEMESLVHHSSLFHGSQKLGSRLDKLQSATQHIEKTVQKSQEVVFERIEKIAREFETNQELSRLRAHKSNTAQEEKLQNLFNKLNQTMSTLVSQTKNSHYDHPPQSPNSDSIQNYGGISETAFNKIPDTCSDILSKLCYIEKELKQLKSAYKFKDTKQSTNSSEPVPMPHNSLLHPEKAARQSTDYIATARRANNFARKTPPANATCEARQPKTQSNAPLQKVSFPAYFFSKLSRAKQHRNLTVRGTFGLFCLGFIVAISVLANFFFSPESTGQKQPLQISEHLRQVSKRNQANPAYQAFSAENLPTGNIGSTALFSAERIARQKQPQSKLIHSGNPHAWQY